MIRTGRIYDPPSPNDGERLLVPELFLDGGLAVDFVDGVFIDVEGEGPAVEEQVGFGRRQQVQGVLHRNELAVEDPAGGIIDEDQEHAAGAPVLEPRVVASVELLQFAHTGAALPPSAVLDLVFVGSPKVCLDHATSESRIG